MGAKIVAFAMAIVTGLIVADIIAHPQGTSTASTGVTTIEVPLVNGLLGSTTKQAG